MCTLWTLIPFHKFGGKFWNWLCKKYNKTHNIKREYYVRKEWIHTLNKIVTLSRLH